MVSTKKDICYFVSSKDIGATYHLCQLATELSQSEHFNYCFLSDSKEQTPGSIQKLKESGACLKLFAGLEQKGKRFSAGWKCIKAIYQRRPEFIHTHTNFQLCLAILLKPFIRCQLLHTIHAFNNGIGGMKQKVTRGLLSILCRMFVFKVFVPSQFVMENFKDISQENVYKLYLGYQNDIGRETFKLTPPPLRVIYCAKFHSAKNHMWLLKVLKNQLINGAIQLILPGDGVKLQDVKQWIHDNNVPKSSVELPGWVEQNTIAQLYNRAHVAVIPSSSETFGYNIVEPLSYGKPVVSFPVGVAVDIEEGVCVTVIPFFDHNALLGALKRYGSDADAYSNACIQAKVLFGAHFSWRAHVRRYEDILLKC